MEKNKDKDMLIKEVKALLEGGNAHKTVSEALKGLSEKLRGAEVEKMPYTIWQLVYHICIAQWDILEFSRNSKHQSPNWPDEYWPKNKAPKDNEEWRATLKQIEDDRDSFIGLLEKEDIYKPFPHGEGQNLLREALLIADHTSYHTSEIIMMRRLLGDWK